MDDMYFGSIRDGRCLRDYQIPAGYIYTHAFNECLHNHPETSIREVMRRLKVHISFDLDRYWFCLTGLKKEIYWNIYGYNADDYLDIYKDLRQTLMDAVGRRGWRADIFMAMKDDEKQIAILMSPGGEARCDAEELAEELGSIVQRGYETVAFKGDRRYCNVTALSKEFHDFSGIREGYLQARVLNDLSFFHMVPQVLTAENVGNSRNTADYPTVMEACFQISLVVDEGDVEQTQSRLETLFLSTLRWSYSRSLCRDALSYFKNLLQVRGTVYGILDSLSLDDLCNVENYLKIEECVEALSPVFAMLCAAVKERGPCSRTVLQAMYYIKNHYAEDISLPDVARYANVNPNYISGIFRENTGMALRDYITKTRVEAACKHLAAPGAKVGEVAAAVGFYDAQYFARVFKRLTGVSPAQYRREYT